MPHVKAKTLEPKNLARSASNVFTEKTIQEFKKTGDTFAVQPWQLMKSQQWLNEMCDANFERRYAESVTLEFIFQPENSVLPILTLADQALQIEDAPAEIPAPRRLNVERPQKKAKAEPRPGQPLMRRPAAAMRRPAAAGLAAQAEPPKDAQPNVVS